jgi:uncharacterized protein YjbI with pentapeptide repeats
VDLQAISLEDKSLLFVTLRNTNFQDADITGAKILKQDLEKYQHLLPHFPPKTS